MEDFKTALRALTAKRLKEEAGKYNKSLGIINGYSKMTKEELITEMSKYQDKFSHLTKLTIKEKPEVKYIGTPTKEEKKARKMDTKEIKGLPRCGKKGPFPCRQKNTKIEDLKELKEYKQLKKDSKNPLLTGLTESQKDILKMGLVNAMVKELKKKEIPKQTLTRDKMELMKLEVERDRFAKNKEEKQMLTKQINKIKRDMKKNH